MEEASHSVFDVDYDVLQRRYVDVRESVKLVDLPPSVGYKVTSPGGATGRLEPLAVCKEYAETSIRILLGRPPGGDVVSDLLTVAAAQLRYIRSWLPVAAGEQLGAGTYLPISNETFYKSNFGELVAIYLYKAMPNQMPRPNAQMAATAQAQTRTAYKYTNNMSNMPQAGMAQQQQAVHVQGQDPLTASMLAQAPLQEQKQMLGERLFPLIQSMYPELAGKITGMLLEIDNSELLHMLESRESLKAKVEEAVAVLQAHQAKEAASAQTK